ncbi:hypothetical protein PORY_001620 [Pneumocystis oryctolagi]|uniref:Uncharacterized protein n=1 Tax=Pneumocystis oryctolagi TaxID=42067 RepID=A0ACB7CD13_9ASCO|nr:hypothetical protein PORY_001620 [Pneumocystis oryctolagi]
MYTGKAAIRTVKNLKYSDVQNKVRSATSNDPWGPSGADMNEIARMTFDPHSFSEVMDMLDRRMNDKGKNWRHVFKALTVLDYCLHSGSENTVKWAKDNIYIIKTLREFNYISDDGKDQGSNIRIKARDITELLQDDERLRSERKNHTYMHDRLGFKYDDTYTTSGSLSRKKTLRKKSPASDMFDDDKELQYAIKESKLQSENDKRKSMLKAKQEEEELALALQLSKEEEQLRQMTLLQKQKGDIFEQICQQPQVSNFFDNQAFNSIQQQPLQSVDYAQNMYPSTPNIFQIPQNINTQNLGYCQPQMNYSQLNYPQTDYSQFQKSIHTNNPYSSLIDTQLSQQNFLLNNSYINYPQNQFNSIEIKSNNPFAQMVDSDDQKNNFSTINSLNPYHNQKDNSNHIVQDTKNFSSEKPDFLYQAKLSALLQSGNPGIDTFGNVGDLRIPSQHTVGESVNSYGMRTKTEPTGVNTLYNQKQNPQICPQTNPQANLQMNQQISFNRQPIISAPTGIKFTNSSDGEKNTGFPSTDYSAPLTVSTLNPYNSYSQSHTSQSQNNPLSASLIEF